MFDLANQLAGFLKSRQVSRNPRLGITPYVLYDTVPVDRHRVPMFVRVAADKDVSNAPAPGIMPEKTAFIVGGVAAKLLNDVDDAWAGRSTVRLYVGVFPFGEWPLDLVLSKTGACALPVDPPVVIEPFTPYCVVVDVHTGSIPQGPPILKVELAGCLIQSVDEKIEIW